MKRLVDQSYYELLEISRSASAEEVERAYERAKALYGAGSLVAYTLLAPDDAEVLSRRIEEARAVLLEPQARAVYDARLPPESPEQRPSRPAAVQADAPVSFPPAPTGPSAAVAAAVAALKGPPQAVAQQPPPAPEEIPCTVSPPEGGPWTGELLRRARESCGLSVVQVSERTRVSRRHIDNIEMERFQDLPAPVYLRGFLVSIARELHLDGQKVARTYLDRAASAQKPAGKHR